MSDLIERLRSLADCDARAGEPLGKCMREAADEIARLTAENAALREVLAEAREALAECADGLEAEIEARYPASYRNDFPSELRRYTRDIAPVHIARRAITAIDAAIGGKK